jgi:hypothetical protein
MASAEREGFLSGRRYLALQEVEHITIYGLGRVLLYPV